jgi:hypothetical protein
MAYIAKIPKIMILTDTTQSMGKACDAICQSFNEICLLGNLMFGTNESIQLASIGDYDHQRLPGENECGWNTVKCSDDQIKITNFLKYITPHGGRGQPEAYKTAFCNIIMMPENERPSTIILLCDSIPHHDTYPDDEGKIEKKILESKNINSDFGSICYEIKKLGINVITLMTGGYIDANTNIWHRMGYVCRVKNNSSIGITKSIMHVMNLITGISSDNNDYINDIEIYMNEKIKNFYNIDIGYIITHTSAISVLENFDEFIDVSVPNCIMTFTTNKIIGKFIRKIFGTYSHSKDQTIIDYCDKIKNKIEKCKNILKIHNIIDFYKYEVWNKGTFEDVSGTKIKINEIVNENPNCKYCILNSSDTNMYLSGDDIGNFCHSAIFSKLSTAIGHLIITDTLEEKYKLTENPDDCAKFVPIDNGVTLNTFFYLVPNLFAPGRTFSSPINRCMFAILCLPNKYLKDYAYQYLKENCGKWIKWGKYSTKDEYEFPVCWSSEFMSLLRLMPEELLTQNEIKTINKFFKVTNIIKNQSQCVEIKTPLILNCKRELPTWKRFCDTCGKFRCYTIFPSYSSKCGICLSGGIQITGNLKAVKSLECYKIFNVESVNTEPVESVNTEPVESVNTESVNDEMGIWVQCNKCTAYYTIVNHYGINKNFICHYCRHGLQPSYIECVNCSGKFVNNINSAINCMMDAYLGYIGNIKKNITNVTKIDIEKANIIRKVNEDKKYICPCCINNIPMMSSINVKISDLISYNDELRDCLPFQPYSIIIHPQKSYTDRINEVTENDSYEKNLANIRFIKYKQFVILNSKDIIQQITNILNNPPLLVTCNMCISDVPHTNIVPICGNCDTKVCKECVNKWYSSVKIGKFVSQSQCTCPYCKQIPKRNIALNFIENLRPMKNKSHCIFDPKYMYGICLKCKSLDIAYPYSCSMREEPIDTGKFICSRDECLNFNIKEHGKRCPGCGVISNREYGCSHMTCPIKTCNTHWCWKCGKNKFDNGILFDSITVYQHIEDCSV